MNIVPFKYQGVSLTVIADDNGDPEFEANILCELLGYANPRDAIARHCKEDDVVKRDVTSPDATGRARKTQRKNFIKERSMWRLVMKSQAAGAEGVQDWIAGDVLPSIRKTGSYTHPKAGQQRPISRNQVAASILLLRSAAEDLKFAPSAVLGGYQRIEAQLGVPGLLPAYAIDAPASSVAGSSEVAKAVGDLLEEHGVGMSAIAFNRLLMQHGFLEERERPSSKGGTKRFKVCTDLEYGKNATHPSNPRETQPLWYPSKFAELLELVLPAKPTVIASRQERSHA